MPDAWNAAKIRQVEYIRATPTVTLLRVTAKPPRRRLTGGPRPALVAEDGQTVRRFAAIPAPPDDRGVLRAAYAISTDLLAANVTFSLELANASLVALPAAQPGAARTAPESAAESSIESSDDPERVGTDERRWGLVSKLTELSGRLAESEQARRALEQSVAPRNDASRRPGHVSGADERTTAGTDAGQSAAALEELDTWRGELERRLTETVDELDAARSARRQDEAVLLRLGGELADAEARIELLQARVTTLTHHRSGAEDRAGAAPGDTGLAAVPYSRSEREAIAHQAGRLVALLASAERLTDLAGEFAEARSQAETLHAAARAEPAPDETSQTAIESALAVARAEIADLREELAEARDAERLAHAAEAVRLAAEGEARELAEREIVEAASSNS